MAYQVPQFIETEEKLVGPFTLYQFIWLAGIVGITFVLYKVLTSTALFIVATITVVVIGGAFGFLKIDEIRFLDYLGYAISFLFKPKQYLFKEKERDII